LPSIETQVEVQFIRPALLGESILPFRVFQAFEAVVPIDDQGVVLDSVKSHQESRRYDKLGEWMSRAEGFWNEHSSGALTLVGRFDYHKELSSQFPIDTLRLVYAKAGTLPAACVIRDERAVIDHMLYWTAPASEEEAHYLAAILNSETARARAERYQARGQFGARHFDKVMFNLPIPVFANTSLHRELARAGARAEQVAGVVELVEGEKFQRARKRVRDALADEGTGGEIEKLVEKLLDG
jgi:hypothetical protein